MKLKWIHFCFLTLVFCFQITQAQEYERSQWKHWSSQGNCLNTRAALLVEQSLIPVSFTKRKDGKSCTVSAGRWHDFYYAEVLEEASTVDIDHVVPLFHAHHAGGANWAGELKEIFANDPLNLVITNRRYNRQKGAKTPLEWMPIDRRYACRYMSRWMEVKTKYELMISKEEVEHQKMLNCDQFQIELP